MTTKYVSTGTALGNFDFTGTLKDWQKQLEQLREVAPEFTGEITEGSGKSDFSPRGYVSCLFYDGEKIAEEVIK